MTKKKSIIIAIVVFVLIMLYFVLFSGSGLINRTKLNEERKKIEQEIEAVKKKIAALKIDIERLKSSDYYIEKYARDNYRMIKPNEIMIKIEENTETLK